jgi:hypothetical protein
MDSRRAAPKTFSSRLERRTSVSGIADLALDGINLVVNGSNVPFEFAAEIGAVACDGRKALLNDVVSASIFSSTEGVFLAMVEV